MALIAVATAAGCGSSDSAETTSRDGSAHKVQPQLIPRLSASERGAAGSQLRPVQWKVVKLSGEREVIIASSEGYCIGERPPRFQGVQIAIKDKRIYIRPYVNSGARQQNPERKKLREICRGSGSYQEGAVRFPMPIGGLRLYDATVTPPLQRWP